MHIRKVNQTEIMENEIVSAGIRLSRDLGLSVDRAGGLLCFALCLRLWLVESRV